MLIDASAIVAILAREPDAEALLAQLDRHVGPFLATPVALLDAVAGLAAAKARGEVVTPALLAGARDAVTAFAEALGLREVPVSADLGRRAMARLVEGGGTAGRCLSEACAAAYRVPVMAARSASPPDGDTPALRVAPRPPAA